MSSVADALADIGKKVNGATPTPKNLNSWLKSHGGYSGNLFVWGSVGSLGLKYGGKISDKTAISNKICASRTVVILNVNRGGHWVLANGCSQGKSFNVKDPGYSKSSYSWGEVTQAAWFTY